MKEQWYRFRYWLHRNIGLLDETGLKHRSIILFISAIILVTDPDVTLTFGSASLAGLGISVEPPQSIPVGLFLIALIIYRLTALWASVILDSGTDPNKANFKASEIHDPSHNIPSQAVTIGDLISDDAQNIIYKWSVRKILWELAPPNIAAIACLIKFTLHHICQT